MNNNLEPILEKTGRMLSRKYGINVICRGHDCCTDGNTIYLPALPDEIPDKLFKAIRGYIDHECSHVIAESDFKGIKRFIKKYGQTAFGIYNALEDARVERVMQEIYPGSTENLSNAYHYALENSPPDAPLAWQVAAALYATAAGRDAKSFSIEALKIAAVCTEEAKQAASCTYSEDVEKLAIRCWHKIEKILPRNTDDCTYSSSRGTSSCTDSESKQNPDCTDSKSHTSIKPGCTHTADSTEGVSEDNNVKQDLTQIPIPAGVLGNLGKAISSGVSEYAQTNSRYRVYTTEYDRTLRAEKADSSRTDALRKSVQTNTAAITQRFLQILQSRKYARWLGDKDEGKLNPRSLHKVCTNSGNNIFRQRVKSRRINTAISLLLDLSGSMHEKKLILAQQTAAIFSMSLEKLQIATSITGFTTDDMPNDLYQIYNDLKANARDTINGMRFTPLHMTVFKNFNEKFDLARLASAQRSNLTPLGDSLMHAARKIITRKEERKIIFCLTDGRPCVGLLDEAVSFKHTRETVQRIQKAGIEVVLIGIREESVSRLSDHHIIVNNLSELPKRCMQELKNLLT